VKWNEHTGVVSFPLCWERRKEMGDLKESQGKKKKKAKITIHPTWCKGCYICLETCPQKVYDKGGEVSDKGFFPVIVARPEDCNFCLQCEMLCPDLAIDVKKGE
jgi:2-oxoglutarate ferredoxin oxidoreductase subunit delta